MSEIGRPHSGPLTLCVVGYATSTHVASRAKCFADLGHRVVLLTETRSDRAIPGVEQVVPGEQAGWAFKLIVKLANKLLGPAGDHVWRALAFISLLIRLRPDIVHIHFAYSYYGWLAGVIGCRPLVVTVMGGDVLFEEQGTPTEEGKWLTGALLKSADLITSKSNFLTGKMDERWGVGGKCLRILWGIPVDCFSRTDASDLARSLGVEGRTVLLSPRILQPLYQVHLIVEAMPAVLAAYPDTVLLITEYGVDVDYRTAIQNRVAELGIGHAVIFCGHVQHSAMPRYYSISTLSVAVPSSDGLPQTLLEGMACGTPNVLSRLPRYEELITHGESAWLVEQDPASIAAGILHLLDQPALRSAIARNARAVVETDANLPMQANRVETAYYDLKHKVRRRGLNLSHCVFILRAYRAFRRNRTYTPNTHSSLGNP